jgi:four helix bundle protein
MAPKKYFEFYDLTSYKISHELSNKIWFIVIEWDYFAKDTVGKQLVKAVDSISANIAEGQGRYSKKDKVHFYRYSFGSVKESMNWILKAYQRNLITNEQYNEIMTTLNSLPKEINSLIKYTNTNLRD